VCRQTHENDTVFQHFVENCSRQQIGLQQTDPERYFSTAPVA
jgi:hypothetical protein